jgi:outer membrane receptor protein involved in Fe transport
MEYGAPLGSTGWEFDGNVNVSFRDKSFAFGDFANEKERELDDFVILNAMLTFTHASSGVRVSLVGSNLTDEMPILGNQNNPVTGQQLSAWVMRPREYGVEVGYSF